MTMINRVVFFFLLLWAGQSVQGQTVKKTSTVPDEASRTFWLQEMDRMLRPVLRSLAQDSLRLKMPQMTSTQVDNKAHRIKVQYVEVLGRVLSGIGPWLALDGPKQKESFAINTERGLFRD